MILDGYGLNDKCEHNAVCEAKTPIMDQLMSQCPYVKGQASGLAVGLPDGQMGNSEVGHLNMGAGRVVYQELTRIIVEKSASHYAKHPAIIGWQIDNEINCEKNEFYSESDTIAFRKFLMEKYGSIDALNDAWGTNFWNQTYNSFEEVHVPRTTLSNNTNPHEVLDYTRFVSDSACKFAKLQSDIIRKYLKPGDFITTNGLFGNLDNQRMTNESLDFIMYDSYPNFAYCLDAYKPDNFLKDRMWSRNLSEVRAVSKTSVSWNSSPVPMDGIPVWQLQHRNRDR